VRLFVFTIKISSITLHNTKVNVECGRVENLYVSIHAVHNQGAAKMPPVAEEKKKEDEVPRKVEFDYSGDKIILPENMDLDEARKAIDLQLQEENVTVSITEQFKAFPLDGAVAMMKVLQRRYGWTHLVPTQGFFGPRPPQMIGVEIAYNQHIQVPWGQMQVPKIDGTLSTGVNFDEGMPCFCLRGQVKRKHERAVAALAK
jgi:hypothetical protein